jgi:hypothetical protein
MGSPFFYLDKSDFLSPSRECDHRAFIFSITDFNLVGAATNIAFNECLSLVAADFGILRMLLIEVDDVRVLCKSPENDFELMLWTAGYFVPVTFNRRALRRKGDRFIFSL